MTVSYKNLITYINENIRFGSSINNNVVRKWFSTYSLTIEEKYKIYEELEDLQINIKGIRKEVLSGKIQKLLHCLEGESEIDRTFIDDWCKNNKVLDKNKENLIKELELKGIQFKNESIGNQIEDDIFDAFGEGDLDSLFEDESFKDELNQLEEVADKSHNKEYLYQYSQGDEKDKEEAIDLLVRANERLIFKIANYYSKLSTNSYDFNDMKQAGFIGLMKAIEKFDINKEFTLSTYATHWIRQSITREIADYSTTIRIPVHYRERMNKFINVENRLWEKYARPATTTELAEEMELTIDEIEELRNYIAQSNLATLDKLVGDGKDTALSEFIADDNSKDPMSEYAKQELKEKLFEAKYAILSERETAILIHRFGLNGEEEKTLQEIGEIYGVSRERIRQVESKAIKKLQKNKLILQLKEFLYED